MNAATATAVVPTIENIRDVEQGLDVSVYKNWLSPTERKQWWHKITENVQWHRVKYKSNRFKTQCETPCYTTFYGGDDSFQPYIAIPDWLMPLVQRCSSQLMGGGSGGGSGGCLYNAILIRLYFDGKGTSIF